MDMRFPHVPAVEALLDLLRQRRGLHLAHSRLSLDLRQPYEARREALEQLRHAIDAATAAIEAHLQALETSL